MNSISVIGLGKMGSALASTLLDAGYRVMGRLSRIEETVGSGRRDQADTCSPGEKSRSKRIQPITREQGTATPTVGAMMRAGMSALGTKRPLD